MKRHIPQGSGLSLIHCEAPSCGVVLTPDDEIILISVEATENQHRFCGPRCAIEWLAQQVHTERESA